MLKVCKNCTTKVAHSLDECPQCTAPIAEHPAQFVWDHELTDEDQNLIAEVQDAENAGAEDLPKDWTPPPRPADSATAGEWKAYAEAVLREGVDPEDWPDVANMTKAQLIKEFGHTSN
jgi:hypothetical protein